MCHICAATGEPTVALDILAVHDGFQTFLCVRCARLAAVAIDKAAAVAEGAL